jgi:hypothetical protein
MKIAQGTRVDTLVKRAVSKIGPLVHRDDSRFVSTDTAKIVDQAVRTRLQDASAIASAKAKPTQKELDVANWGVWAVLEITEGDPVLTGAVADALLSQPVGSLGKRTLSISLSLSLSLSFAHLPALRYIYEAPRHAFVLKKSTGVRRFATAAPREQPHRVIVLGLGLRRRPLALGLLNAQRNQTNDARY